MMHPLIDTHAHLYSRKFEHDRQDMVRRALAAGVAWICLPNIDGESVEPMLELEAAFPDHCAAAMGLHPCSVQPDTWEQELANVEKLLGARSWVGIGETGIDLYWDKTTLDWLVAALERQLEWCLRWGKPFSMHVREAWGPTMDVLRAWKGRGLRGVLHCFTGSREIAAELTDMGLHLGIGGVATFPKAGVVDVLRETGLDRVVLETDSPYLAPVPFRGKRNESAYVRRVAEHLAAELEIPLAEVAAVTTRNAQHIFGL
jgi:TatD DNase family protein